MAVSVTIIGDERLDRVLKEMRTTAARRAISLGMRKAAQQLSKKVKASIPSRMKEARKTTGWRSLKVREAPGGGAKVGRHVGRTGKKAAKEQFRERTGRKGAGLGRGLAWVLMGVADRQTGKKGGPIRRTGRFPKSAPSVGHTARANASTTQMLLRKWVWAGIKKEVSKGKAF